MARRYAVYYAPERGSALDLFGMKWLGRCAETGSEFEQPDIPGLPRKELCSLTSLPRHYGFHGTIVAPFEVRAGFSGHDLIEHAESFARSLQPFDLQPLTVQEIGSFIALVPESQEAMCGLAEECLYAFHPFREAPTLAEMERRKARGLTQNQERNLVQWGYPFVLDEYMFHITLTDSVSDRKRRRNIMKLISEQAEWLTCNRYPVCELCLFRQESRQEPFMLIHRARIGQQEIE